MTGLLSLHSANDHSIDLLLWSNTHNVFKKFLMHTNFIPRCLHRPLLCLSVVSPHCSVTVREYCFVCLMYMQCHSASGTLVLFFQSRGQPYRVFFRRHHEVACKTESVTKPAGSRTLRPLTPGLFFSHLYPGELLEIVSRFTRPSCSDFPKPC